MKMFGKKSLSEYLFYFTRLSSILIVTLVIFIVISILTKNMNIIDGRFYIDIPFINFQIKGFYKRKIFISILATLSFYVLYIHCLSLVFKSFRSERIFTSRSVKYLKYFTILNLVLFPIGYLIPRILSNNLKMNLYYLVLHGLIGVFSLFLMTVFSKGYNVQSENDLTI